MLHCLRTSKRLEGTQGRKWPRGNDGVCGRDKEVPLSPGPAKNQASLLDTARRWQGRSDWMPRSLTYNKGFVTSSVCAHDHDPYPRTSVSSSIRW